MTHKSEPYIIIAQQDWYANLGSNARNLALEMSKSRKVLYVNPPLDINTLMKHARNNEVRTRLRFAFDKKNIADPVDNNIWVHTPATVFMSINWLRSSKLFNFINRANAFTFFFSIKKALKQLGWATMKCTVFNDSQMFVGMHVNRYLQPGQNFYYIRDNLVHHPYFVRHGSRIEPGTIRQAHAVFANSSYLADYARNYNFHSLDVGQGCELEMYNPGNAMPEPADLAGIPHPRIGYTGFLTGERLDIPLLEALAEKNKNWHWVLIGPEEIMFQQSRLHHMRNVYFTGAKKAESLPAYLMHLDVCINPQLVNELTIGNYPRKIDEYLAMGKPVVATDTPAMKMFLPHVHLATGCSEYKKAIELALQQNSKEKSMAAITFAQSHTWENCIKKIFEKQTELLHA